MDPMLQIYSQIKLTSVLNPTRTPVKPQEMLHFATLISFSGYEPTFTNLINESRF